MWICFRTKAKKPLSFLTLPVLSFLVFMSVLLPPEISHSEQVTLSWDAPTTYTDGTSLTDYFGGYKVYYGTSSGNYPNVTDVGDVTAYTVSNLPAGNYYFAVTTYDKFGNESDYSNEVVLNAPLVSTVTYPVNGAAIKAASYVIQGTASQGTSKVEVGITGSGGTSWYPATGTASWTYSWSPASDGNYAVTSRATDASGNVEVPGAGISVAIDRTTPSSAVTAPAASSAINRSSPNYYIVGTATDAGSGIKGVEVSTNGGASWSPATGTSSWSYVWTLPVADGPYGIMSRATDSAGNVEPPKPAITLTIDGVNPTSNITSPAAGSNLISGSTAVNIAGTASDNGTGVKQVGLSFDGGATWVTANGTSSWNYSWNLPAAGSHTILSRATDNAGNTETPGTGVPTR